MMKEIELLLQNWVDFKVEDWKNFSQKLEVFQIDFKEEIKNNEELANICWIYQHIALCHMQYCNVFYLIKSRQYYTAWCLLERVAIILGNIKNNFEEELYEIYGLNFLETTVVNLQTLYPYRIFTSSRTIIKEKRCSICDEQIKFRGKCNHKKGMLYHGELCLHKITDWEWIAFDIVDNPVDKFTVLFTPNNYVAGLQDHYDYFNLAYYTTPLYSPYEKWDIDIHISYLAQDCSVSPNNLCPCGFSIKTYADCCLLKEGIEFRHYEIIYYLSDDEVKRREPMLPLYPFSAMN